MNTKHLLQGITIVIIIYLINPKMDKINILLLGLISTLVLSYIQIILSDSNIVCKNNSNNSEKINNSKKLPKSDSFNTAYEVPFAVFLS